MEKKLNLQSHTLMLSITLFILLIVALVFGANVVETNGVEGLLILVFAVLFLLFVFELILTSLVIRTRDELHAMHEENAQQFQEIRAKLPRSKEVKR